MRQALTIDNRDHVAVAVAPLPAGTTVAGVELRADIPAGHKFALRSIGAGQAVLKYGYPIGVAARDIAPGEHVHTHNLTSALEDMEGGQPLDPPWAMPFPRDLPRKFSGYRRASGRAGTRNEIWIINTVGCVNQAAERIAAAGAARYCQPGSGIDGVHAFAHPFGCSQLGDDLRNTQRVLAGLIRHPNAAAVLILGLGCENNQLASLLEQADCKDDLKSGRIRYFNAQDVPDEVEEGLLAVTELAAYARQFRREPLGLEELVVGMKCGGSDGFSGISANPLVGTISNLVAAAGGTVLLSEVPEMFGAENVLLRRAADKPTQEAIVRLCNDFRGYFKQYNQPIDENPSPGNKAGGLSTNAEKSLGCVQKAGAAPVRAVLAYGQPAPARLGGVALVNAPGNDGVSSTAMVAAGATMLLFTTGRGTPMGFPAPTIKIASNSSLAQRKPNWIDFNAGELLDTDQPVDVLTHKLFLQMLQVASGETRARNETAGQREISIWKNGVTL